MKFKKIYIEITNRCNLNCPFCSKTKRELKDLSLEEFTYILKCINDYTDYIYLHVKGEPLLHPELERILKVCQTYHKQVNITTNGTLLKKKIDIIMNNHDTIRQINISLHNFKNNLQEIFPIIDYLNKNTNIYLSLRLWNGEHQDNQIIYQYIKEFFSLDNPDFTSNSLKIKDRLYLDKKETFIWPSLENDYYNEEGTCYGLRTHLAILSDGRVIPCCLDSEGIITLGNIFKEDLETILNKERPQEIIHCFQNKRKVELLCKKCSFLVEKK